MGGAAEQPADRSAPRCGYCGAVFASKNQLFRHLRASACTAAAVADGLVVADDEPVEKVGLLVGCMGPEGSGDWRDALWRGIDAARGAGDSAGSDDGPAEPGGSLECGGSAASSGPRPSCPWRKGYAARGGAPGAAFASEQRGIEAFVLELPRVCDVLSLSTEVVPEAERAAWCARANAALPPDVRILGRSQDLGVNFHADACVLRRCYECLVPASLLLGNEALAAAAAAAPAHSAVGGGEGSGDASADEVGRGSATAGGEHVTRGKGDPRWGDGEARTAARERYSRVKAVLRRLQGEQQLHNFAPALRLSPNDTAARRYMYRLRAGEVVQRPAGAAAIRCLSVAVDALLTGQLECVVGVAVAVAHGLLPEAFVERVLSGCHLTSVPAVPGGTTYLDHIVFPKNFHVLHPLMDSPEVQLWRQKVQDRLADRAASGLFDRWYREELLPAIPSYAAALEAPAERAASSDSDAHVEKACAEVLRLLREAEASGDWPGISRGRKQVIKAETLHEHGGGGGSFTLGSMPPPLEEPATNRVFPELVRKAFELEMLLRPQRQPSSTIAVNKHAQFLPHVDSGAGAGQGRSLIVGLGDYTGGELVIEGDQHSIRYRPKEFNGWTQRHWTLPFEGERYSLVWFTPRGCEERPGLQLRLGAGAEPQACGSGAEPLPRTVMLPGGLALPRIGYGTFQLKDAACEAAVVQALEAGYGLLDTASIYKNEAAVGAAVRRWQAGRAGAGSTAAAALVESKCSTYEMGFDKAKAAFEATMERLGIDVLDLYLIHWPAVAKKKHASEEHRAMRHQTWRALESLYLGGRVRAIGVSNFTASHLSQLVEDGVEVMPMVNQIEVHPFFVPQDTIDFCKTHRIVVQAYSPLGGGPGSNQARATEGQADGTRLLLGHPAVLAVAAALGRSAAQVLLRWSLQHGFCAVPRSSNPDRIAENVAVFDFELTPAQMADLDALRHDAAAQKFCWDSSGVL